jgi:surface protein
MKEADQSDSNYNINRKDIKITLDQSVKKASNRTVYIRMGIAAGIMIILAIILMAIFIPTKHRNLMISRRWYTNSTDIVTSMPSEFIENQTNFLSDITLDSISDILSDSFSNFSSSDIFIDDSYKKEEENNNYFQSIELLLLSNDTSGNSLSNSEGEEFEAQIFGENFAGLPEDVVIYSNGGKINFNKTLFIKSENTTKVEIKFSGKIKTFKEMFYGCYLISEIIFKNIETDLIYETTSMFKNCTNLNIVKFENTSCYQINRTAEMFQNCPKLTIIDIENFDTYFAIDMSKMFLGCSSINDTTFIEQLSTINAEFLNEMFSGCSEIKSLNLLNYQTMKAINMSGMFKEMTNLENLEISSFRTYQAIYMNEMFFGCSSLVSLYLSNFYTENVITMEKMFDSCIKLETLDISSFKLTRCNNTQFMFRNTTRNLMLSIEKNEEIMKKAGATWSEKISDSEKNESFIKIPLDLAFIVDATSSMRWAINKIKNEIIYISVHLMEQKGMEKYNLSLSAIFYRDPVDRRGYSEDDSDIFDFDINPLNLRNFVENIYAGDSGGDRPEDWAGAFESAKNLTWRNNSYKFIIHIVDAPGHGNDWKGGYDDYPEEGNRTDEIFTYFAQNNFSIAGFNVPSFDEDYTMPSFRRAQTIFRNNGNFKYFIKLFPFYSNEAHFLNLVYESFQNILYTSVFHGFDLSEEQGHVNWDKIKDDNNTDFVIIRAGIGENNDTQFENNYKGAKNLGIPIGIYWYSNSSTQEEAKKEAEICEQIIEGKQFEFPIFYMIEEKHIFDEGYHNEIVESFCSYFNSTKYLCGLSSDLNRFNNNFKKNIISDYQLWVSYYDDTFPMMDSDWGIWKFNDGGKINGIGKNVSLDLAIINYPKVILDNHYNGY